MKNSQSFSLWMLSLHISDLKMGRAQKSMISFSWQQNPGSVLLLIAFWNTLFHFDGRDEVGETEEKHGSSFGFLKSMTF